MPEDPRERPTEPELPAPNADEEFDDEEPATGVSCLACGGEWRIKVEGKPDVLCYFCTGGVMLAGQITAWKERKR